jgi:hypothetical protein
VDTGDEPIPDDTGDEPEDDTGEEPVSEDLDGDGHLPPDDCDDADPTVYPGADELCDDLDNDCDGEVDEDPVDPLTWYGDSDGDGFGTDLDTVIACSPPTGYVDVGWSGDCDDDEPTAFPGGSEVCDEVDNDCDGSIDEDAGDAEEWYRDADGDGFGTASEVELSCSPSHGYVDNTDDCDDGQALVFPDATEFCNAQDDDCDGTVDEDFDLGTYYEDADGDGHGNGMVVVVHCTRPSGYVTASDDCDDTEFWANPGLPELCDDDIDNNCDGETDEPGYDHKFYPDADSDGYGSNSTWVLTCSAPPGHVLSRTDCDDGDASVNPGAVEVCNWIDDDCDGVLDDGLPTYPFYEDVDGDGFGVPEVSVMDCARPAGYAHLDTDCNDADRTIHPGAYEMCDGEDDDCDGVIDDDCGSSRILGTYEGASCTSASTSLRETGDFIDVSYNSDGTWNDASGVGFMMGDGAGTYYEACYYGSPWQQVSIEYESGGASYNHTGNYAYGAWSWDTVCGDSLDEGDVKGVIHQWDVADISVTKTEIWETEGSVSRVWFDVDNHGAEITNMRLMFAVDPDHDYGAHGSFSTENDLRDDGEYAQSVGPTGRWTMAYGACDPTKDDLGHTGWSADADAVFSDYEGASSDSTMHWRHTEDLIGAGSTTGFGFLVTVGLTPEDAESTYDDNFPILCAAL